VESTPAEWSPRDGVNTRRMSIHRVYIPSPTGSGIGPVMESELSWNPTRYGVRSVMESEPLWSQTRYGIRPAMESNPLWSQTCPAMESDPVMESPRETAPPDQARFRPITRNPPKFCSPLTCENLFIPPHQTLWHEQGSDGGAGPGVDGSGGRGLLLHKRSLLSK